MDKARSRIEDGPAEELVELGRDTNATAHRMEEKIDHDNAAPSDKQDTAAGKQDTAAEMQQTDLDLSKETQRGVDRLEKRRKGEGRDE